MADQLPQFEQMAPTDGYWQVQWLGEVSFSHGGSVRQQPRVAVTIARFNSLHDCFPDTGFRFDPDTLPSSLRGQVFMPVSTLPILRMGGLWKDGRPAKHDYGEPQVFEDVLITKATCKEIKAGGMVDGQYLLPSESFSLHFEGGGTAANCVVVSLPNGDRMVVPCWELIRFYFGSSGTLVQKLISHPFKDDTFWTRIEGATGNRPHLWLAPGISGANAADLARIACSKHARRAAAAINSSCQLSAGGTEKIFPSTSFPFVGYTTLKVRGRWLHQSEPSGPRTFVVFQLIQCSGGFPFNRCHYTLYGRFDQEPDQPGQPTLGTTSSPNASSNGSATRPIGNKKRSLKHSDADPGRRSRAQRIPFNDEARFLDLVDKPIWHEPNAAPLNANYVILKNDGKEQWVTSGTGERSASRSSVDLLASSSVLPVEATLPRFVRRGLSMLESEVGADATAPGPVVAKLPLEQLVFAIPPLVTEDGEIVSRWEFVCRDGTKRAQRACVARYTLKSTEHQTHRLIVEGADADQWPLLLELEANTTAAVVAAIQGANGTPTALGPPC